uniref:Transmembrane protein n=1 Tax=Rhodococcus sp. NS1 TaxID=402236 RepID=Q06G85_9NOCA|nr:hypothetical protein [Rhodococcus sp. NS1]ABI79426.1 hypothetical protein PNSL1.098 [Rhodococcus sp. NS1]
MLRLAGTAAMSIARIVVSGSWGARAALVVLVVMVLAFGGTLLGPVTMQTVALVLVLLMLGVVVRLLVGGGRR